MNQLDTIKTFIGLIKDDCKLNEEELLNIWHNYKKSIESVSIPFTEKELQTLKKIDLQIKCKSKGLKQTGTKQSLINRLLGREIDTVVEKKDIKIKKKSIIDKIKEQQLIINVRRNQYNNFEDSKTGFVFNNDKLVIGKQVDDKIVSLTNEDVELCKEMGLLYIVEI